MLRSKAVVSDIRDFTEQKFRSVQEDPENQGAWPTFGLTLPAQLPAHLAGITRISRRAMSAPSSGSSKVRTPSNNKSSSTKRSAEVMG
jgi:2-oxoglutarate dehydrogenase complex dehydrogenase (E1) component-like enzyme